MKVRGLACLGLVFVVAGCGLGEITGAAAGSDANDPTPGNDAGNNPVDSGVVQDGAVQPEVDSGIHPLPDAGDDNDVFATDPVNNCSTGQYSSASQGLTMQPGQACITCHTAMPNSGPIFTIAGTVYATGHEAGNCNGVGDGSAVIRVMDASGTTLGDLVPNSVGTFTFTGDVPAGYRVKVVTATGERAMIAPPPHGDCNACHTTFGDGNPTAPGRIRLP